jgi:hypothetical protein
MRIVGSPVSGIDALGQDRILPFSNRLGRLAVAGPPACLLVLE